DEKPSDLHVIFGFDMSTQDADNGCIFELRHRNQIQTDRKDKVIIFRVERSGSAEKWLKALTDGLGLQEPNGHAPES
uniref:PH domain-containing protein n=1 Tax=Plectus sambesii TaxID=2011161 RepID=A0A914UW86_9BILA